MSFTLSNTALPAPEAIQAELRRQWQALASAGTWFDGPARVAIAAEARAARRSAAGDPFLSNPVVEAARTISAAPASVDRGWVEDLRRRGLTVEAYVEIAGIAGRLSAIDTYTDGVGAPLEPLPDPLPGEPSRQPNLAAAWRGAFVPTKQDDSPPRALSAVPAEAQSLLRLHGVLYMPVEDMGDLTYRGDLSRVQMEFVAARTSWLNDCRF